MWSLGFDYTADESAYCITSTMYEEPQLRSQWVHYEETHFDLVKNYHISISSSKMCNALCPLLGGHLCNLPHTNLQSQIVRTFYTFDMIFVLVWGAIAIVHHSPSLVRRHAATSTNQWCWGNSPVACIALIRLTVSAVYFLYFVVLFWRDDIANLNE